jgi:C1A family cysteine protease
MTESPDEQDFDAQLAQLRYALDHRPPMPARLRRHRSPPTVHEFAALGPVATGPKDWRDAGVITPVRYQGSCGACASFAASAAIEALLRIANSADQTEVDAGYMHTCTVLGGEPDCTMSADLGPALVAVVAKGYAVVGPTSAYPYPASQCGGVPTRPAGAYAELASSDEAKNALMRGPVVAEFFVWPDFMSYRGQPSVYVPNLVGSWNLHSVCIIGFDAQGWIIKNSYGTNWGVGGFATIAYGTCGLFGGTPAGELPGQVFALTLA